MKLRLHLSLLTLLLGGLSSLIPAYSLEVTIPDGSTTRQEYTEETTVKYADDVLSYKNWVCLDSSTSLHKGAIFNSQDNLIFSGSYDISITGSSMSSLGGFIYSQKNLTFSHLGDITLTGNTTQSNTTMYTNGGLLCANGTITFSDVNDIYIANNLSEELSKGYPSLIYSKNGGVVFERTGNITFSKNISKKGLGNLSIIRADRASTIFNDTGDILFEKNEGVCLSSVAGITFIQAQSITFNDNHGLQGDGGAIQLSSNALSQNRLVIMQSGDVKFLNNSAGIRGGAISSRQYAGAHASDILLSADKGDILFLGNMYKTDTGFDYKNPVLNAIQFETWREDVSSTATFTVRAQEGREVTFFDPVISVQTVKGQMMNVDFNAVADSGDSLSASYGATPPVFSGTIRFSGKHVQESIIKDQKTAETDAEYQARLAESKHSNIRANTILHGGTLILEEGAVYGTEIITAILANALTTFSLKEACLEIKTGGTLNAVTFTTTGRGSLLRAGNDAHLFANHVDLHAGFSFDFTPFLDQNEQAGLFLHGGKMTLGGELGVYDNAILDYYSDNRWANVHSFVVLDATKLASGTAGALDGIVSQSTGSNVIDSAYGYQGTWSYEWKDNQLLVQWTPRTVEPPIDPPVYPPVDPGKPEPPVNPGIQDVHPELAGNLTLNSLWSSVSNINSFETTALGQLGLQRFQLQKDTNYWASGLGDFSYHDTVGKVDGYEYAGGGGAVGTDTRLTENIVVGMAFGSLFGTNKSDLYSAEVEQESYMGMIYGAGYKRLDENNMFTLQGSAVYGLTDNRLNTTYSDGQRSNGGWDNNTFQFTLKGSWDHVLGDNWMITTFIGLEYTDSQQKAFTESGDRVRSFGTGSLRNLSTPVGFSFNHLSFFSNGMRWLNSLSLSYVPDVYRKNPEAEAVRLSNGFTWTAQGSKLARNAARIDLNTRLMMNETWSTFAGYSVEGREKSLYQAVNLGVSATF